MLVPRPTYQILDRWETGAFEVCEFIGGRFTGTVGPRFASVREAQHYATRCGIPLDAPRASTTTKE